MRGASIGAMSCVLPEGDRLRAVERMGGEPVDAEGQKDEQEVGQEGVCAFVLGLESVIGDVAIEGEKGGGSESEVEDRAEGVVDECRVELTVEGGGPASGESAARAGPVEEDDARAGGEAEFTVGAEAVFAGMENDSSDDGAK